MPTITTDIDIDFPNRLDALKDLPYVPAMMWREQTRTRHPSGIYLQNVPTDPLTGLSSFDYDTAATLGYAKIDILSNSLYEGVRDESHLVELMNQEPDWSLLEFDNMVERLAHIRDHYGVVKAIAPKSIEDLAVVLALVRPGKRHLLCRPRSEIDLDIWQPDENGYVFKRAHAIAYAVAIVVQMNLICEQLGNEMDANK